MSTATTGIQNLTPVVKASAAEVTAGTNDTKFVTPLSAQGLEIPGHVIKTTRYSNTTSINATNAYQTLMTQSHTATAGNLLLIQIRAQFSIRANYHNWTLLNYAGENIGVHHYYDNAVNSHYGTPGQTIFISAIVPVVAGAQNIVIQMANNSSPTVTIGGVNGQEITVMEIKQ